MFHDESMHGSAALRPASNDGDAPSPILFPAGDFDCAPVAPPEGRWKRKRAVRTEGPRTLFLIFGKTDARRSKTFSHGGGVIVDPAT